jgi:eukaryotic-like serine/threonine-protein kinase
MVARVVRPGARPPEFCGRYHIAEILGRGAMGVVYKAHDPLLDRDVALKLIKTDLLDADERSDYLRRFMHEAQAAARCAHRGIVGVYDFSENDGSPFIVMEFVNGPDLRRMMRDGGAQTPARAVPIMLQILDALDHAHRLGIVHRDIKPPNILVPRPDEVKIADFGIARLGAGQATQAGVIVGTPQYMAPEQARGDAVDLRADLFSAAAVFLEMLTGKAAFGGDSYAAILGQVLHGEPQAPDSANASQHPELYAMLRRALAKAPADRFGSAAEFAAALQHAAHPAPGRHDAIGVAAADDYDDYTVYQPPGRHLDAMVVEQAEKDLATFIGPLAKVFVRQVAANVTSAGELYRSLSAKIADEGDRTSFMQRAQAAPATAKTAHASDSGSHGGTAPGSLAAPGVSLVPSEMQVAAQTALTVFLGPIAKVLVRKAVDQARTTDEFFDRLAAHLTRDEDRAAFRRQVSKFRDPRF